MGCTHETCSQDPLASWQHHLRHDIQNQREHGSGPFPRLNTCACGISPEKIHVYIKTPERDGKTQTVKCGDRPFDKIRFYVTEKDLIDDGKATASHEAEVMPLYRIEVTAVKERLHAA